jgi:hypothetical protein
MNGMKSSKSRIRNSHRPPSNAMHRNLYGSRWDMAVRQCCGLVVCKDENGCYATTPDRFNQFLADPRRYASSVARRIGEYLMTNPQVHGMHQAILDIEPQVQDVQVISEMPAPARRWTTAMGIRVVLLVWHILRWVVLRPRRAMTIR